MILKFTQTHTHTHWIFIDFFLSRIGDLLAARAHVAQSMAPTDSVAEWTHAGPRPGAVGAALLATYS